MWPKLPGRRHPRRIPYSVRDRVHRFLHPRLPRRIYDPPLGYVGCRVCDEQARRLEAPDARI